MKPAFRIHQPKGTRVFRWKFHGLKRDDNHPLFHAVEIAQLELAARKIGVPADSVQEFLNGHRGTFCPSASHSRFAQSPLHIPKGLHHSARR
jgi:hypothetical protein